MDLRNILSVAAIAVVMLSGCNGETSETKVASSQSATSSQSAEVKYTNDNFFDAAFNGQIDVVVKALGQGIDVNAVNAEGRTALMLTSFNGHLEIIQLLVSKGANTVAVDTNDRNALMYASTGAFNSCVELLLASGAKADVNAVDNIEHWTAVMFAAGEGQMEVVKTLLAAGADINMVDIDGESSFDFAVANKHPEMAQYLTTIMKK